ncbi:type VI secretion protein [Polymorphobacter multimanifer]|uniref:Type VI secretion system protein ImpJ n=1 Tax=Polymorphobacter multimanifer TaxID=1070431 RepID=A0A841L920_9SPHN|nr:type VI secretion system baseplate subunit TssK [Polymorphobacter multimanifer]MBB6227463.1 type VI secretion system protein ImpJ [Polymorphobacter multimanifer]GGI68178.1 type VI secretion protein [Polymorphobacter multimanifer]
MTQPVWSEGLFLRPQHLQMQGDAGLWALHARMGGAVAHPWGLVELTLDEDLGSGAKVGVRRLVAVMQDGEVVAVPGGLAPPPPLDVDDQVRGRIVYLTLPARQEGAVVYTRPESADANVTRYLIAEREVVDQSDPDRNMELVEVALPNLHFGIDEADLAGRTKIGIGRIRELVGKRVVWDDAYIPPVLDIRASPTLAGFLVDILGRLEQRQEELSLRAVEGADGGSETFAAYLLLQLLNRWQPELKHLQRLERVHPERLYTGFLALAGELATFTRADRRPGDFPTYEHEDLEACFKPVVDALRAGLSTEFSRSAVQLELKLLQPGAYVSTITDRGLYDQGRFYLAVSTRRPSEDVRRSLPSVVKIGAVTRMQQLVQAALPGVPLAAVAAPPPQIRAMAGYVYFELDRSHPDWKEFATAPALGLYIAGEWPDLAMELWCVRRTTR